MSGSGFTVPEATRLGQRRAADPRASAWVSANAGAGKTKVLTDRVIRLLLAGTAPSRILCLTFTKAAAANMTIRVFAELGRWVTLDDVALADTLRGLTGETPSRPILADARRLFARSVETPGGLKIETIHAFCERVLHLVPFEANVPASFTVLDDSQIGEILAGARADVLTRASLGRDEHRDLAAALEGVAAVAAGDGLLRLIDAAALDESIPSEDADRTAALARIARTLGLVPGDTASAARRAMLEDGLPPADRAALAAELRLTGGSTDAKRAAALDAAAAPGSVDARLAAYLDVFFKEDGEPRSDKDLCSKKVAHGVREALAAERHRLDGLRDPLRAAETLERTAALYRLAGAVRERAEAAKARLGALDFADLIGRTLELLRRDSAAWVLYRLDRGIDHVLVDEAQDTNPAQWEILKLLTEEFTAGAGQPARSARTVFAVGDPKQSIYSFQGADPRWFEQSRRHWLGRSRSADLPFEDVRLDLSFRSAATILGAVDSTFAVGAHYRGLSFDDSATGTTHTTARRTAPGQVEIWPTEAKRDATPEPDAWKIPVDTPDRQAPAVVLATRIAAAAKHWTSVPDDTGRVYRPGEILILVRRRGPVFFAVIRALKKAGVPVAGADRFDIGEHIAVNDLVAAGGAALLPGNDLVLAAALKSPLVGLDDDDLIRIAADRREGQSVFGALAERAAAGDAPAAAAHKAVMGWQDLARRHGPFGFYAALLGPQGGRRRLVERLGPEAADAIDAFLIYAQTAEIGPEAPSLTTFLARFESAAHTIKRDLDSAGDDVKVMTVHGAKGLEAPLVVVVDGSEVFGPEPPLVGLVTGDRVAASDKLTFPVWSPGARSDCRAVALARQANKDLRLEEHNRLLYVAMTRAKDRLVIAPYAAGRGDPPEAWAAMIRRGFSHAARVLTAADMPYGPAEIWAERPAGAGDAAAPHRARSLPEAVPDWLHEPVAPEPADLPPLRPSGALEAADRGAPSRLDPDAEPGEARRRGVLIHAAIEHLADVAAADRPEAAGRFLAVRAPRLDEGARVAMAAEVLAVLGHADLAPLFGPDSRGEVAIAGTVGSARFGERAVSGQVDRLAVTPDGVLLADFKTGGRPPDGSMPPGYRTQLALYAALLARIHPDRPVRAFLVWTADPAVVEIDAADLVAALDL